MIFVDTGAWFAWYIVDDVDHDRAEAWFRNVTDRLVTTDFVVDELLTLLKVRGHADVAFAAGEALFSEGPSLLEHVSSDDIREAWIVFSNYRDKDWSFTDCTSRVVMERLGISRAVAFDERFGQFGTVTVEP